MNFKCKVVYDFQSIEFDYEVTKEEDKINMFGLYKDILEGLKQLGDEIPNPNKNAKKQPVKEEMATAGQVKFLINMGFSEEEAKRMTKKQAWEKIKELS
jgi:hypothetical protein